MSSMDGALGSLVASDEAFLHVCDSCTDHSIEKEAEYFCENCGEYYCKTCTESHAWFKATRDHRLIPVNELPPRHFSGSPKYEAKVRCVCDQNLETTIYCEDHNDVLCVACKSLKHGKCQTVEVKDRCAGYRKSQLGPVIQRAETLKTEMDNLLRQRSTDLQTLSSVTTKCRDDIQTFRKELNGLLDKLESEAYNELSKMEVLQKQTIENQIITCSTTSQMLDSDIALMNKIKKTNDSGNLFAADVKVSNRLRQFESSLVYIMEEPISPLFTFKTNSELTEAFRKAKTFGIFALEQNKFERGPHEAYRATNKIESFLDLKVESASPVEIKLASQEKAPSITGCTFLPDGRIVLCDKKHEAIIMLDSSFAIQGTLELNDEPWDVAVSSPNGVIVTVPGKKQVQNIEVLDNLKLGTSFKLDKQCWGVEVAMSDIFVTCHSFNVFGKRDGEIRILDQKGNTKAKIGINADGKHMFRWPYYLALSASLDKVFVSDDYEGSITCLKFDGSSIYTFKDQSSSPRGLCADEKDNVIVCALDSHAVQIVTAEGKLHRLLLSANDGIKHPRAVAYRKYDNTLIVGCRSSSTLFVFKVF